VAAGRGLHQVSAFEDAVWIYRITPPVVRTLCFVTGKQEAEMLCRGWWSDRARGWSPCASDDFTIHEIADSHTGIMFNAEAARILTQELELLNRQRGI
jgi:hypothetical protein